MYQLSNVLCVLYDKGAAFPGTWMDGSCIRNLTQSYKTCYTVIPVSKGIFNSVTPEHLPPGDNSTIEFGWHVHRAT